MINDDLLSIRQEKTGDLVHIPLIPEAVEILERYDYQLPVISNQKMNVYLKELFNELELNREVLVSKQEGKEIVDTYHPLSTVKTYHIARKSFITLALTKGINAKQVQEISGHKKDQVFNRYVNFSAAHLQEQMQKMSRSARALKKVI